MIELQNETFVQILSRDCFVFTAEIKAIANNNRLFFFVVVSVRTRIDCDAIDWFKCGDQNVCGGKTPHVQMCDNSCPLTTTTMIFEQRLNVFSKMHTCIGDGLIVWLSLPVHRIKSYRCSVNGNEQFMINSRRKHSISECRSFHRRLIVTI